MGTSKVEPRGRQASMATMGSGVRQRGFATTTILQHPHPALSRPSYDVDPLDHDTVELAAALIGMLRTTVGCVGLSAPQLGHNMRLFCIDVTGREEARSCAGLVLLANPEILSLTGHVVIPEQCTSVPGVHAGVGRARSVVIAGIVPGTGRRVVVQADALEARCILHHLDHLDGILFVDRVLDPVTARPPST